MRNKSLQKLKVHEFNLFNLSVLELVSFFNHAELQELMSLEPFGIDTIDNLNSLLEELIEEECYEVCALVRDEIEYREHTHMY